MSLAGDVWAGVLGIERRRIFWRVTFPDEMAIGPQTGAFSDLKTLRGALRRIERAYPKAQEFEVRFEDPFDK